MHVPNGLDEWTYETIIELAKLGQCESERHDFKFNLPDTGTLTKICCAFANSLGGFIVVGVKERSGHFLVEGLAPDRELAKKFADKLHPVPSIDFAGPRVIGIPGALRFVYAFHIPRSAFRPHMPREVGKGLFWKRTPGGCEPMTHDEVYEQFLRHEERRDKLKLLFVELLLNRENLQSMSTAEANKYSLITLDNAVLDRLLVDTYSVVQTEPRLVQILLTLRTHIRGTNAKTQMFFSKMALPLSGQEALAAKHNQFMKEKAEFLSPLIDEAIGVLKKRFGLVDPFSGDSSQKAG